MCHCLECQRRTGAVISNQARFRREQVTFAGKATAWMRTAESGNALTFHFCPTCGSTVYWEGEGFPGYVAVADPVPLVIVVFFCPILLRCPNFSLCAIGSSYSTKLLIAVTDSLSVAP
jgi:Glutathione-dependent formaldehyde-activating enzyme